MSPDQSPSSGLRPGQFLFVGGILLCIIGGARLPAEGQTWPDTFPLFLGGAALAALGIVLWRKAEARLKDTEEEASEQDPVQLLKALQEPLLQFRKDLDTMDLPHVVKRVDELLDQYILPMGEGRQKFIDRFGMEKGAEILVTLAFAERLMNRVWSAAADGHLPEARTSLTESTDAYVEACGLLP